MPDNPKIQGYVTTTFPNEPVDDIQEGMYRMKIENKEGDSKEFPNRPGEPDCIYYLRTGLCGYGTNCRFNHPPILPSETAQNRSELPQREGQLDCGYYLKTGNCKYGSSCKYHHPLDRRGAGQITLNTLGLPMRQEEKPCPYYMRTCKCKFGPTCKFDHPQPPAPLETNLHVSGPILPPTGIPYVGTFPAWQLSRSSHGTSSHLPDPQTYMPPVFPPLPTPFTPQSWNTYMGEDVCGYFSTFGVCKPGPTSKFEHPMYVTNYIIGMPSIPVADLPFFPSARNVVISNSTEASQSKSSKITDWIQKPETISDNNCQTATKKSVVLSPPKEVHDDRPESSDLPQDQAE